MAINTRAQARPAPAEKPTARSFEMPKLSFGGGGVGDSDRKFFTEQMALLLETGTPLLQSLQALRKQLDNPKMVELIDDLIEEIGQGRQFSAALARHPAVFSTTYTNLVAASEDGGFMHEVLAQLLALDEKREQLKKTMVSALTYPVFLMVFAMAVVVFVLVVVFPKFADLFSQIADQLPASTKFLMAGSNVLQHHWIELCVGTALVVVGFKLWAATDSGLRRLDWARLNLPLLRPVYTQMYLVNALRVLSLSLGNGVGMMDSLAASKHVVNNGLFQEFIGRVEHEVETGNGVAAGFKNVNFIPPIVEQMISTGEETGNLPKVMSRLADYFEGELSSKLQTLSRLAEPVMLLVMGGVVGLIVSSLILPIFKLTRVVG
ncbi:MAG: type II secretion system F family protein [Gammaproteobacteria bacterium]|nr:type II secretion system F family protein [Gammaproteobacteria bacterium]